MIKRLEQIDRPMTELDIIQFVQHIPHFRGVFSRDQLPKRCWNNECGVLNLDNFTGAGTHWTSYYKINDKCYYFDSYGNLQPPKEFVDYIETSKNQCCIQYNYNNFQKQNSFVCGHLCICFLYNMMNLLNKSNGK